MAYLEDILTPDLLKSSALAFRLADGTILYEEDSHLCVMPLGRFNPKFRIHINIVPALILNLHEPPNGYDQCLEEASKKAMPLFAWDDGKEVHLLFNDKMPKTESTKVFTVARSCVPHARQAIMAIYCMSFYRDGMPIPDFSITAKQTE